MTQNAPIDRLPEPRHGRRRGPALARVLGWLMGLGLLAGVALGIFAWLGLKVYSAPGPLAADKVVTIDKGLDRRDIAALLEKEGVISNAALFSLASQVNRIMGGSFKAGEYAFPANASMERVMSLLSLGRVVTYKLSIPEGFTSAMAVARVAGNEVLAGDAPPPPPEGAIMPDTYVFTRGMTRARLVSDMQDAQTRLLGEIWSRRPADFILKTPQELVTLASIVEKETGVDRERPLVASVFLNRLKQGMRLQSDPTIIYALTGGREKLDRPLTRADLALVSPYNTYTNAGLPPTPIANPGRAALEAVINPAQTSYVYFVADGSGGHAFAATLDEHNRNVTKWRKLARDQATADGAVAAAAPTPAPTSPTTAQPIPAPQVLNPGLPAIAEPAPAPAATPAPVPAPPAPAAQAPAAPADPEPKPAATAAAGPAAPAGQAATRPASSAPPKPGSVVRLSDQLVPIPRLKPRP